MHVGRVAEDKAGVLVGKIWQNIPRGRVVGCWKGKERERSEDG
jgi:hypothetical protein